MTDDEIIETLTRRHFKRLEAQLLELDLPKLSYIAISRSFRWLEADLKKALSYQKDDLKKVLTDKEQ